MTALAATTTTIPAMTAETIEQVRAFEALVRQEPQVVLETSHVLHAGIYARTIVVPAGIVLCATLIKLPTIVIVQGHAAFHTGDGEIIERIVSKDQHAAINRTATRVDGEVFAREVAGRR